MSSKKQAKKPQGESELYKKTDNIVELLDQLRDSYIEYKKSCSRCKIQLQPKAGANKDGKKTEEDSGTNDYRNFYLPPSIALLDKPEEQKKFRKEYLNEVGARPEPEPLTLLADSLHFEAKNTIADRSNPEVLREELAAFFRRHTVELQHKKYKMLGRWANQATDCQSVETDATLFDRLVGRLQMESDSARSRTARLEQPDAYDEATSSKPTVPRPQPTSTEGEGGGDGTLLYVEAPDKPIASAIRQDDIEVHMRLQNYRTQLFRFPEKLATSIKWLPYSKRFEIWSRSRIQITAAKVAYETERAKVLIPVKAHVRERLIAAGVADEKVLDHVCEKYTLHLEVETFQNNRTAALNSHKALHQKPPFLFTSNVELKESLIPIALEYDLRVGDALTADDGFHFSYLVQALWPAKFQQQVLAMQFDWHDSGEGNQADTDVLLIQKLTNELGLDKNEMLAEMAKQAEVERNKSILGKIGKDQNSTETKGSKAGSGAGDEDDFSKANLIRRIKEMKFFSLDETDYKLKKSDWLQYVCWLPNVSDTVKRANFRLSNSDDNPIDSLLLSAFEFIDVNEAGASNKILEDSATAHVRKVRNYFTDLSQKVQKIRYADRSETEEAILYKAASRDSSKRITDVSSQDGLDDFSNYNQAKVEEYLQNVDPLKQNLIKAYYTLRLLKTRATKAKMIQALNYFRGVQKRLAHDVREFYTRDRALGGQQVEEALIGPQFGKDSTGNLKAKSAGSAGPGGINANRIIRDLEDEYHYHRKPDGQVDEDPISIKGYKFNKRFNPVTSSTCPCLPRYHTTYGRPTLYEEVSAAVERREESWRYEAHPIVAYKDKLVFQDDGSGLLNCTISVLDEHGIRVVYEETINDMVQLEEEMIKIGSYFLNKAELAEHTSASEGPSTMLDRSEVASHVFEQELELQVTKVMLVEILLQVYEHTCDPLESIRILQIIVDTMALRPRINLEATYFKDSYVSEIKVLKERLALYKEVLQIQRTKEIKENREIRCFQELKIRKLQDYLDGRWVYKYQPNMIERMGLKEESERGQGLEQQRNGTKAKHMKEIQKQLALKEIAERHITEFAGDQHTDFAQVLGLPEVTAEDLFKKQAQQDPIVIDAIREHAHFSKQIEGYPWFFNDKISQFDTFINNPIGLQNGEAGLTDFFQSFCSITRIHAACEQAYIELSIVHKPENGMADSALEGALLQEARGCLKVLRIHDEEGDHSSIKSANQLEEDFYLASSDKLMFLMRELKSELHPDRIALFANPLIVTKLDILEVAKFNFPRLKQTEIEGYDQLSNEKLTEKMIGLAKISISRKYGEELDVPKIRRVVDADEERLKQINSPSLMTMACNTTEAIRLREELIRIVHETDVLSNIYRAQLVRTGKSTWKLVQRDPIPFETQSISKDNFNLVDFNDGSMLDKDLAFTEFDVSIGSCMNFRSESCIKGLMTNIGVEELRGILHYQLMQRQLLAIGVMRNQTLMDGPCQGQTELQLLNLKPQITVPAAIIDLEALITGSMDGTNTAQSKKEAAGLSASLSKEVGSQMYSVEVRKNKYRAIVTKKYTSTFIKVNNLPYSIETKLRILRSYRLKLLHEFCQSVLKESYQDSVTIQTLMACREIKWKSRLFPMDINLFQIQKSDMPEHIAKKLVDQFEEIKHKPNTEKLSLSQLLTSKASTMFYIPSNSEIMDEIKDIANDDWNESIQAKTSDDFELENVDSLVYGLLKKPTVCSKTESTVFSNRLVMFKEAYTYESQQTELFRYYSQLLQIMSLEYLMGRNNAPGSQILDLEDDLCKGIPYWKDKGQYEEKEMKPEDLKVSAPDRVVAKIVESKRHKMELSEDLHQIAARLSRMNDFVLTNNSEQLKLSYLNDLLKLQHKSTFLHFMNGIENALDTYLRHESDSNFAKVSEQLSVLARNDQGFNLLGNGFYLNQGLRNANQIDPSSPILRDHDQFNKCYQPVVDEQALIPPQIGLVRRLYGDAGRSIPQTRSGALYASLTDYRNLNSSFLNMDDQQRANISTNFNLLEPSPDCDRLQGSVTEYLVWRGLIQDPAKERVAAKAGEKAITVTRPLELLEARVEFFGMKVQARHLQRVLMSWLTCRALPTDTGGYLRAQTLYREQTALKILMQRDILTEQYNADKRKKNEQQATTNESKEKANQRQESILESVHAITINHPIISTIHQTKAEVIVIQRVLDIEMIKMSLNIIKNEHNSLLASFEIGAADYRVHAFVHPQQQFASTLYQSVDPNSHLNVVNKLDFVQSFLTKLRNRCTEVETLASGPGIVFSMKDFNECLHSFCQGLLKHCESELRSRVETQHIRQNQFQHLLYMKEKSALYYRRKCDQFLGDIDKLVNAKISQKGGQLLYELDVSSRELRVLRDNYRLMQKMMTQELRHEYMRAIQEKDGEIIKAREDLRTTEQKVSKQTYQQVSDEFDFLHDKALAQKDIKKPREGYMRSKPALQTYKQQGNTNKVIIKGNIKSNESNQVGGFFETEPSVSKFEAEAIREVIGLQNFIRKTKILNMMKSVTSQVKHEKELANQRAQLTSNAALWDQLAEAEKREQITKQELSLTKLSLASYEKLIEKLQGQLENLSNEKARLQQYKNSKSKRYEELVNKMKGMEILGNIDLDKILAELKHRDKKINDLGLENKAQKNEIDYVINQQNFKVTQEMKKRLSVEREMKLQAYDRLEGLRIEMRSLEGQDMKSDLWKDKCRELFDICKDLETENDQLKVMVQDANQAHLFQVSDGYNSGRLPGINKTINPSIGTRLNINKAVDRSKSGRIIGAAQIGQEYDKQFGPSLISAGGSTAFEGLSSHYGMYNPTGALPENFQSNIHQNQYKTVSGDRVYSGNNQGPLHMQLENAQDLLSIGSGAGFGEQTLQTAQPGLGGIFGPPPINNFSQPRGIMTAGGSSRPKHLHAGGQQISNNLPTGGKRLQTSQGPRGNRPSNSMKQTGVRQSQNDPQSQDKNSKSVITPVGGLQQRTRLHYQSQNPGGITLSGINIQGKGSTKNKTDKVQKLGSYGAIPKNNLQMTSVQPMNFNINFNTTNINMSGTQNGLKGSRQ